MLQLAYSCATSLSTSLSTNLQYPPLHQPPLMKCKAGNHVYI